MWLSPKNKSADKDFPDTDAFPSPLEIGDFNENDRKSAMKIKGIVLGASSVSDIRETIRAKGLRLRYEPMLSRITFAFILASLRRKRHLTMADCYEFLGDSELNAPESKNFLLLLYDMTRFVITEEDIFRRVKCIRDYLKLGIIPTKEVEMICQFIPMTRIAEDRLLRNDPKLMQAVLTSVYKGIYKCPVLKLGDLDHKALRHCFFQLHRARPSWGILSFARDIIATVDPTGLRLGIVSWALTERLAEDFSCREALEDLTKLQAHVDFVRSLRPALPKGRFVQFIASVAENIFLEPEFQGNRAMLLQVWGRVLGNLDNELFEMPRMIWSKVDLANPCRPAVFDHPRSHQLFIRLWVSVAVSRGSERARTPLEPGDREKRIFKSLLATFDQTTDGTACLQVLTRLHLLSEQFGVAEDEIVEQLIEGATRHEIVKAKRKMAAWMKYCRYVAEANALSDDSTVDDVPEDHPRETTRQLFSAQKLKLEEMEKEIISDPDNGVLLFRELDGPHSLEDMLQNWAIHTRSRQSSESAFIKLAKAVDVTDPKVVEKLLLFGLAGPIPRSLLLGLLNHHLPLQIAVSQATSRPQRCTSQHHPEAYLNTLHALAITFACAPYLTPSESWRLVHRVYKFIQRHNGPIRPVMGRALVQAGIQRALERDMRVPLPRWGLASRTTGRLEGVEKEKQLNHLILKNVGRQEARHEREMRSCASP
ncbi:hypothetical protein KEM56_001486 [Ascosphaera pollenicola]|nr:hypothetical protein KEM56_001486 [Ascosphaera pollenicola]